MLLLFSIRKSNDVIHHSALFEVVHYLGNVPFTMLTIENSTLISIVVNLSMLKDTKFPPDDVLSPPYYPTDVIRVETYKF